MTVSEDEKARSASPQGVSHATWCGSGSQRLVPPIYTLMEELLTLHQRTTVL